MGKVEQTLLLYPAFHTSTLKTVVYGTCLHASAAILSTLLTQAKKKFAIQLESIPCLQMPWLLTSPSHQQAWYSLSKKGRILYALWVLSLQQEFFSLYTSIGNAPCQWWALGNYTNCTLSINSRLHNSGHTELKKKKNHEQLQLFYQHEQKKKMLGH